jgi:hypothetical protein
MDQSDITASIAQVDSMLDRVVKVIGRERPEKPLRPDVSYPRRAKPRLEYRPAPAIADNCQQLPQRHGPVGYSQAIASGSLAGNEMRLSSGYTCVGLSPLAAQSLGGKRGRARDRHDDCDPDGMWANFESEFDNMVAGMR